MTRLKNLMKRAANGESLVIGFLGGSITQGSLSSTPKTCYAYLVYEWWKKSFPNAAFSFVNGGIGGTTSHYGGARAQALYFPRTREKPGAHPGLCAALRRGGVWLHAVARE